MASAPPATGSSRRPRTVTDFITWCRMPKSCWKAQNPARWPKPNPLPRYLNRPARVNGSRRFRSGPRSPWPTVIAGAAVLALVVVTGLLIRSSAQVRRLEDRVQELEQQAVLLPTQTPQSTAGTGPATQPPTEAVTQPATEPATEPSMQPTTAPSTQPATDPVMTTAEIAGADLTFTMTIDGQRVTGGCAELGRQLDFEDNSENGAWIGEFALENDPQDTEAELRISLEQDGAQTTIRLSCNVDADGITAAPLASLVASRPRM